MDKIFAPIKKRIVEYIENQLIKRGEFYQLTEISPSNFKGKGATSEIGGDKIAKILTSYPNLNPDWLLTGQGNMLRDIEHFQDLPDNQPQNQEIISLLKEQLEKLTNQLEKKQEKIEEQALELGMLRERLKSFKEERKQSEDAEDAGVAAVG